MLDRLHRHLELHEQVFGRLNLAAHGVHVGGRKGVVGSRGHNDAVFALGVDGDERHARGRPLLHQQELLGQPLLHVAGARLVAEHVVADLGHEGHVAAQSGSRNGLVGALAAGRHHEFPADNGLAGLGNRNGLDGKVGVRTSYYDYFTHIYDRLVLFQQLIRAFLRHIFYANVCASIIKIQNFSNYCGFF